MFGAIFRSLRLSLKFVIPLAIALAALAYAVVPLIDNLTLRWFIRDLDMRSGLIATTLQDQLGELLEQDNKRKIRAMLQGVIKDERLFAIGLCSSDGELKYKTPTFPADIGCSYKSAAGPEAKSLLHKPEGLLHISVQPIESGGAKIGSLILMHDMRFVQLRSEDTRKYVITLFLVLGIIISLITVLVAHLSWRGWIQGVRAMLRGEGIVRPFAGPASSSELQPIASDLRTLLRSLDEERRFEDDATMYWTPQALRELLQKQLTGEKILVVSNREPYIHIKREKGIEIRRPASGLVTAVEPVMRACSGTWIAHGSGSGDRLVVDRHDRTPVPPEHPEYSLRRIWLTGEEEKGYYYGFANEGLWPLCHIAHVRPIFKSSDWDYYVEVNRRFADAVIKEADNDDPIVLVQDYHFALLPGMIRKTLPKATIITFWHIPWPNSESFGICPWREEILKGMLGSTILGFHTPFHCKNFLETVDRYLETRIEHESSTISRKGKLTLVESYPISIQWPSPWKDSQPSVPECRVSLRRSLGLPADHLLGVGVDRMDYTKGIPERFMAIERMLELHPELVGGFSFVQIAAPSRSELYDYQQFEVRVRELADKINNRFASGKNPIIYLKAEHHEPEVINQYYRASDVCLVTSLHDGMNLVAKEFVMSRDDERGVLVLSQFTGAAHELHEALVVNPYHVEQTADALYRALNMPQYEQMERMRSMRSLVKSFNIYRWAGRMLIDAARIRQRQKLTERISDMS